MRSMGTLFIVLLMHLCHFSDTTEGGKREKKYGSSRDQTRLSFKQDQQEAIKAIRLLADVPPGFLNPSVEKHLQQGKSVPGIPGADYPTLGKVPYTSFYCDNQQWPGFFADIDTRCQAWHYCDIDGRQATFLCPNGTQFNQAVLVCDWWFNVRCNLSQNMYFINDRLYRKKGLRPGSRHEFNKKFFNIL